MTDIALSEYTASGAIASGDAWTWSSFPQGGQTNPIRYYTLYRQGPGSTSPTTGFSGSGTTLDLSGASAGTWRLNLGDLTTIVGMDEDGEDVESGGYVTIDWGDGTTTTKDLSTSPSYNYDGLIHTYSTAGTYNVRICIKTNGGTWWDNELRSRLATNGDCLTATIESGAGGATHRINVTARNVDHWSWSVDGGADNMMPPGSTYADITIGESAPTYASGDVVGIAWERQFSIRKTFGGDEDGGSDIDEITQLYFLPFNMGAQTGWHYPLDTPRFEYSGSSYNLSPDSSDFVAHHYGNSNENDYIWGDGGTTHVLGSRYGYLPIWDGASSKSTPTPILMFTDAIFNKLKESDGKLKARYYRGVFDYANALPVTLNGTNYTLTRERVYTNSSYFKSGSTVTLNDSNYGNLRKLYVIKIS